MFIIIFLVSNNLTNYGRRHFKIFSNCHVSWDTLNICKGLVDLLYISSGSFWPWLYIKTTLHVLPLWILSNECYRFTKKRWVFKDDCTNFILSVSFYLWWTINFFPPNHWISHNKFIFNIKFNLRIVKFKEFKVVFTVASCVGNPVYVLKSNSQINKVSKKIF